MCAVLEIISQISNLSAAIDNVMQRLFKGGAQSRINGTYFMDGPLADFKLRNIEFSYDDNYF